MAITPDGDQIVYGVTEEGENGLYVRPVDQLEGRVLLLERAGAPFLSPDGAWVGFNDFRERNLKKISILGGPAVTLCELPPPGFDAQSFPR